jgi:hypothetical protein
VHHNDSCGFYCTIFFNLKKIKRQNMCPVKTNLNRKIKMRHVKTRKVGRYKRGVTRSRKSKKDRQIIKIADIKCIAH